MLTGPLYAPRRIALMALLLAPTVHFSTSSSHAQGVTPDMSARDPLAVKTLAEVESKRSVDGRETPMLVPADRVAPGDEVIYTLEVRNTGPVAVAAPVVIEPVPDHTRYVADSAVGPGAEVSYSVDGGRSFDRAENLQVQGADGQQRPAVAADITHIRWQLKIGLKSNSVAFVRFRAVVK